MPQPRPDNPVTSLTEALNRATAAQNAAKQVAVDIAAEREKELIEQLNARPLEG